MSGEEVESHQVKRNSDPRRGGSVDFAPRPDHHQELRPWTRADYERIGIEPPKETEKPAEEPKVEPEPEPKQEAKPKVEPEPKQEAKPKDEASERHEPPRKPGKLPPFRRPDNGGRESMH
jgi:2-oxoglutarate dehydrogenase E2 component (dihydrolipoamide succinyltransferase)